MSEQKITNKDITVAIVEDNGVARMNLRYQLLDMGFPDVGCYANGRELKASLRVRHYDLLLMDFHLGENKNGVEVIQDLKKNGLIKESTSLIFVTADHLPIIIGQIVDVHPDALILKPYSIRKMERTVIKYLAFHHYVLPVLRLMDHENYPAAMALLTELIAKNQDNRRYMDLLKLKGRLLLRLGQYDEAIVLYQGIQKNSDKIIWVRWGLIQAYYLAGEVATSEAILEEMIGTNLTNDKACEWLARIFIQKNDLAKAEEYVDMIKDGDLSLHAARLKAQLYQLQNKTNEAIRLLEKKRESNRSIKELFAELSFDLARCHIKLAQETEAKDRKNSLDIAKLILSSVNRRSEDEVLRQKIDYLQSSIAVLQGDVEKAQKLVHKEGMEDFERTEIPTMTDAVKVWHQLGFEQKASEILLASEEKAAQVKDPNEQAVSQMMVSDSENKIGTKKSRAIKFNQLGMVLYQQKHYEQALDNFYQAYQLRPQEPAFSLNLLQSLVDMKQAQYKKMRTMDFYFKLARQELSSINAQRFKGIAKDIETNKNYYIVPLENEGTMDF